MLPAAHRLRDRRDFSAVLRNRRGGRAAGRLLVIHCATTSPTHPAQASRVGFVVSKAVGNAVVRNRTKRVLRHLLAARLGDLPGGGDVVVRANPAAATATTAELAAELDRLLVKASARRTA